MAALNGYLLFLPNLGAGSSLFQFAASAVATATSTVSTLCSAAWGVVASVVPATVTAPLAQLGTVVASWAASGAASWSAVGAGAWQWATLPVRVLSNAAAGQSSVPLSVLPLLPTYHLPIAWSRTFLLEPSSARCWCGFRPPACCSTLFGRESRFGACGLRGGVQAVCLKARTRSCCTVWGGVRFVSCTAWCGVGCGGSAVVPCGWHASCPEATTRCFLSQRAGVSRRASPATSR